MTASPMDVAQWWRKPVINRRAWTWEDSNDMQHNGEWWQHAVIYQIVPWSFNDSDSNGIGDLQGVINRMDYIASLGVDAIWLCPIFESAMNDMGYDVTGMLDIDPLFGDLDDFDRLLSVAHSLGIKVLVDQVWNHTSDQHPWFIESRKSRDNSKSDWYVWADAKADGSAPNNWLSAFMGKSAWQWDPHREQYYFYNFLPSQPELNWHNPEVIEAILARAKFWLERGVDGFRLDAVNFFIHDKELRDNPPREQGSPLPEGVDSDNPMVDYWFKYNFCCLENLDVIKPIRELVDQYPGAVTLGEVTLCEDSVQLSSQYVEGNQRLHMVYNSALLVDNEPMSADLMKRVMQRVQSHFVQGGQCWMVGNHDYGRLRSRWTTSDVNGQPYPDEFYHMMAALLLSLPGALCLYQGDELGLPEAKIPKDISEDEIRDPFGKALYPVVPGRDGSRTPMPWYEEMPNAGFTDAEKPWLPIPKRHFSLAVDAQNSNPHSLLNTWRRLLHWRKQQPALIAGDFTLLETEEPLFGFERAYAEQRLLCLFNMSSEPVSYKINGEASHELSDGLGFSANRSGDSVELPSYGVFFADLPLKTD
ncbi:alpha-glucosidase family protein [Sphaerothrix gracilis]|uniref:alpha-glucosidase family protein n=1 Tax=Sphaerothrix gracilis TaxID=3151835 RepID=UPI0031FDBFE4